MTGQQHTSEDEGEHGGELRAQTKAPDGDAEQERREAIQGVLLEKGWDWHGGRGKGQASSTGICGGQMTEKREKDKRPKAV